MGRLPLPVPHLVSRLIPPGVFCMCWPPTASMDIRAISAAPGARSSSAAPIPAAMPTGIAVERYGQYAYVARGYSSVVAYSIDQGPGSLNAVSSHPSPGTDPSSVAVAIQGQYAYVT